MTFFVHQGVSLNYRDEGSGIPFIFQHGLGADLYQPFEVMPQREAIRLISLECRGHGESELGPEKDISIATFADDLISLMDHLEISKAILGGISMGAAVAMRVASINASNVLGLVIARPAWHCDRAPKNMQIFARISEAITSYGCERGKEQFISSTDFKHILAEAPDNAQSLLSQFDRPNSNSTAVLLSQISTDGPQVDNDFFTTSRFKTLVIGHGQDLIHPLILAKTISRRIPNAQFIEIASKSASRTAYLTQFRAALDSFVVDFVEP
jgi:pimeloyl-ACP methyl ester carboxylesterase